MSLTMKGPEPSRHGPDCPLVVVIVDLFLSTGKCELPVPTNIDKKIGSIEVSAVRSNYQFWGQKPAVISNFKLQFAVITKIQICSLQ